MTLEIEMVKMILVYIRTVRKVTNKRVNYQKKVNNLNEVLTFVLKILAFPHALRSLTEDVKHGE